MARTKHPKIDKLEATWQAAYEREQRLGNAASLAAENEAYDALDNAKDDLDMCKQVGCRVIVHEHAYCDEHRAYWQG